MGLDCGTKSEKKRKKAEIKEKFLAIKNRVRVGIKATTKR